MAYTDIDKPSDYFNTKLYTGNGSTNAITGVGFQPDWVWCKNRASTKYHGLYDSVRGTGTSKSLASNSNEAEGANANFINLTSFDSDGFTLGATSNTNQINTSGENHVSWNWKAGTSFSNDASATGIGSIDSTGSVSTDAGFSICSYTGTGSVGTVKHGLGVTPKMILFKNRTTASNWLVYHEALGNTKNLYLDATNAEHDRSDTFNDTSPTSSVFTVGTADLNTSGNSIIAYCFSDVKGYSKFSSYVGNGSSDGSYIHLGFKPSFLMYKASSISGQSWLIHDNKRGNQGANANPQDLRLLANATNTEADVNIDFLSNGFKTRAGDAHINSSGTTYIYMAFAENPFTTSTGVPATAR